MARRTAKLAPINISEFYDHSSLNGLVSFLNVPPTKDATSPPGVIPPRGSCTPEVTLTSTMLDSAPTQVAAQWRSVSSGVIYEASRVRRVDASRVQESLSSGENKLYSALWDSPSSNFFTVIEKTESKRIIRAGSSAMSRASGLNDKTVRDLLPRLVAKKVVRVLEEADVRTGRGRVFEVLGFHLMRTAQREAGLGFIVKLGQGVEFAVPHCNDPRGSSTRGGHPPPGVRDPGDPGVIDPGEPGGHRPPPSLREKEQQKTSLSLLRAKLSAHWPEPVDDDAARQLLTECRKRAPDATLAEIEAFVERKARKSRGRSLGHLLTSVANCFEPGVLADLRQLRQGREVPTETPPEVTAERRAELQRKLADSATPEYERQAIRVLL